MAQSPTQVQVVPTPTKLTRRDVSRILVVLVGTAILAGAVLSPWWTRGTTLVSSSPGSNNPSGVTDNSRPAGVEGFYMNYAPFSTPGGISGFSTDSSRAAAVAVLGVSLLLCAAFLAGHHVLRLGIARGSFDVSLDAPVRFAILAFVAGLFAVLWGLFFLPMLGNNPGLMWGNEYTLGNVGATGLHATRYANVGFYLGIVGAVLYPAYIWIDANTARNEAAHESWESNTSTTTSSGASFN